MTVVAIVLLAWAGLSLAFLVALLKAKPHEPTFYDLTEDQT
jgi:hypothetical protein